VVEVPSGVKVRVLRENRSIGESSSGETLVPDLMPYYGNRLSLATRELALGLELEASERVVAPPYRGGARVTFQLVRARYVRGVLVLESDGSAPAFGTLTIIDAGSTQVAGAASSPVGAEGEFELAGLGAGLHRGEVEYAGGRCVVVLIVPSDAAPIVTIGRVLCQAPTAVTP
jgi:outer membrane usher protein